MTCIAILWSIACVFAANHVAARFAFNDGVNVLSAVIARSSFATIAILLLILWQFRSLAPVVLAPQTRRRALGVGLLILAQSLCLYSAVARLPVALALLIFQLFPLIFVLFNRLINQVPIPKNTVMVFPLTLSGLALVLNPAGGLEALSGIKGSTSAVWGVVFAISAALLFGLVLALSERWLHQIDGRVRSLYSMAVVGASGLIVALAGSLGDIQILQMTLPQSQSGWFGLVGLSIFYGSAFIVLWGLMPRLQLQKYAAVMNFEPVAALVLGWLILGQSLQSSQILGAALVICGLVLLSIKK